MKLLQFDTYESYVEAQTATNKQKLNNVWVSERELRQIADYYKTRVRRPTFGICHGVRNGYEVQKLRELLGFNIIGTEISETADLFENVIQWDFHDSKEEWIGNVDFLYSNSWDHSCDPERMFATWLRCLSPQGRCFLQWSPNHAEQGVGGADCFGVSLDELKQIIEAHGRIEEVLHVAEAKKYGVPLIGHFRRWVQQKLPAGQIEVLVVKHHVR